MIRFKILSVLNFHYRPQQMQWAVAMQQHECCAVFRSPPVALLVNSASLKTSGPKQEGLRQGLSQALTCILLVYFPAGSLLP